MNDENNRISSEDGYWAASPTEELVAECANRIDAYYQWVEASTRRYLWASAYNQYYKTLFTGPDVNYSGAQNEYNMLYVNHTRNVMTHFMNLVASNRPAFEPRAANTDSRSQKQTVIAKSLLEYYTKEKGMEVGIRTALENAMLYGESFVVAAWNASDGEVIGVNPDTGIEVKEGDMEYRIYEPMDVVRDVGLTSAAQATWWMVKTFRNRWDLIAQYPEQEEALLAAPSMRSPLRNFKISALTDTFNSKDIIETWELYHDRTPALPDGRFCLFLYEGQALLESTLPYSKMPVYRLSAADIGGQSFGYGSIFDLLNIQEALDGAYSTIQTNAATFGVQSIVAPKGANISATQVTDGLNLIEYNNSPGGGKPEAINFLATAPETFNFTDRLQKAIEQLAGINSVIRGEPPSAGMSGTAMALLASQAVQFSQGLEASYIRLVENLGTATIATLRDYATTKRVVAIVGKSNRSNLASFTGEDLASINRVQVSVGNAIMRTTAGKVQIAQDLLTAGLIKNPIEYLGVIETGNLETMTESPMNQLMSIKAESEQLTDGKEVSALILDDHKLHLQEHAAIISDPAVRNDPARLGAVMAHMNEHWALWSDPGNASFLQAIGQTLPPPGPAPAGPAPSADMPLPPDQTSPNLPGMPGLPGLPPGSPAGLQAPDGQVPGAPLQ